jgi:hypothetical protein
MMDGGMRLSWVVSLLIVIGTVEGQDTVQWGIDTCRITTASDGTFMLCEQQAECAAQSVGSNVNCSVYTYKVINIATCISTCCWELSPVPTALNSSLIQ